MKLLLALLLLSSPVSAQANTPMPVPDPAALAAARTLIAALPIEQVSFGPLAARLAGALEAEWERYDGVVPEGVDPAAFRELLAVRLRVEAGRLVPLVLPEVEEAFATAYALRFSVDQLEAMRSFYETRPGARFALNFVWDSAELAGLVEERVRQRIAPRMAALIAESAAGVRLLARVNAAGR